MSIRRQSIRRQLTRTTAAERRRLAAVAVVALVPFVLLAIWAHSNAAETWEQQLVNVVALGQNLPGDVLLAINSLGNLENWAVVLIVLALAAAYLRGIRAGLLIGASYLVDPLTNLTKNLVERGRPDTLNAHLLFGLDSYGYPSGHTARAAALAGALIWAFAPPRWRLPAAIIAAVVGGIVMGYARMAFGVHFPSDVLGGLLIGLAWFAALAALL